VVVDRPGHGWCSTGDETIIRIADPI